MSRHWPALELRFALTGTEVPEAARDEIAAALSDLRATAWQEFEHSWLVFFASPADRDRAATELRARFSGEIGVTAREVEDEDWARRSQEGLQPVTVGRIVVAPPWSTEAGPHRSAEPLLRITVLPSMGFGTGHHASTRLCLALLQQLSLGGKGVLDVGTGSGVLALAAWRLGAGSVLAVDDDADALASARDNLSLNGADTAIVLQCADFRGLSGISADVVVANLTGALLAREASTMARMVAERGDLIVSGITVQEEPGVVSAFTSLFAQAARLAEAGWVGLRFNRTGL